MTDLKESRNKINEIDSELAALFEQRMHTVREIIRYKSQNGLPVLDSSREEENRQRNAEKIQDETLKEYFLKWYQNTMDISKQYQKDLLKKED
ncbi:MAG: chorismate mutase [Erysipelotrichia bacterium]|nr:chorismate mutase [Erysipelotrichia bacterium]